MATKTATGGLPGLATVKVLAGSLTLPSFTVAALAEAVGVSPKTVDDILRRRYKKYFYPVGPDHGGQPGRPAQRWALRDDRASEVVDIVDEVRRVSGADISRKARESELADASLVMAANAVTSVRGSDPESARSLLRTVKYNLELAGFAPDGSPVDNEVDASSAAKARLVAVVGDLVEAELTKDQRLIDEANLRALPVLTDVAPDIPANEWLPLAVACQGGGTTGLP